jgi:hypothetical protein
MRGRVMSNMAIVTRLGNLSQTQSGILTGVIGPGSSILVSAAAIAASAAITGWRNHDLWEATPDHLLVDMEK